MAYKRGDRLISSSPWFRVASFLTFYSLIVPAAILVWALYRNKILGRRNLRRVDRAITVSNHTLLLDPVMMVSTVFPGHCFQTLLEETVCAPVVGTLTRLLGGVPIPRRDVHFDLLKEGCLEAFRRGKRLHFYPEGECYLYNASPRKFHSGAFFLSASLDVPIIPMATVFHQRRCRPTVHLHILEPVHPADFNVRREDGTIDQGALRRYMEAVRQMIADKIQRERGTSRYYKGAMDRIRGINTEPLP